MQQVSPCWIEVRTSLSPSFLCASDKLVVGLHLLLTPVGNSGEASKSIDCSSLISESIGVVAEILVEPNIE